MQRTKYTKSWSLLNSREDHFSQRSEKIRNLFACLMWNTSLDLCRVSYFVCDGTC